MEVQVKDMIKKAAEAHSSDDALKFSQAALNAAKALVEISLLGRTPSPAQ